MKLGREKQRSGASQGIFSIWQGVDFRTWVRLLSRGPNVHWSQTLRLMLLTGSSMANSVGKLAENLVYGRKINAMPPPKAPVFILGHWRSGTTLLHNLMSLDPRFTCPNLYHILAPHHFLLTEKVVTSLTSGVVPKKRPMDNMAVSWDAPQEDETAMLNLTLCSPYMMLAFQGRRKEYENYFDFAGLSKAELENWKREFLYFLKKLTYRAPKTLLLKSPPHSYRIPLLREMFPDAKFINIVRNPYAVFPSSMHLRRKLFEGNTLGIPNHEGHEEDCFRNYQHLMQRYEADKVKLADDQLVEMRFEDLEQDPVGELRKVYQRFDWENFGDLETAVTAQLGELRGYKKNEFQLEEDFQRRIYERCRDTFERYNYPHGFLVQPSQPAQVA